MIEVSQFSKFYEGHEAVHSLSFSVAAGEILGLIGPNGAGKTTTLRTLAGILQPSAGAVSIAGFDLMADPIEAKRRLAFIPDVPRLFDGLTIREHLEFTARTYRLDVWTERAEQLLALFEIEAVADKMASQLSLGMSQKAIMCCAMLHQPQVLLLDEPLTGLDPRGIRTLLGALRESADQGAAVMLSTHLLGQISDFCDRLLIVKEGRCLLEGTLADIQAQLPATKKNASIEEIFFHFTEARDALK